MQLVVDYHAQLQKINCKIAGASFITPLDRFGMTGKGGKGH